MKKEQSNLIDHVINPTFLEQIKQPANSIALQTWFCFNMKRNGRIYQIIMYTGKEGQVNISNVKKNDMLGNTIIIDYCKNMDDFLEMIKKLDDLAKRMPAYDD